MKPQTIKWVDVNIGRFICFLLTMWRNFVGLFTSKNTKEPERILFIKFIEQGATVLAYSALKRAIDKVGRENVFFCVFSENRPILDLINIIPEENVLEIRDNNFRVFLLDTFKALIKMRKLKIDSTVDMEFFSRASAIFGYLSGASKRVGLHRFTSEYASRGRLLTHEVQHHSYIHTSRAYLLLVERLLRDDKEVPSLKIPVSDLKVEVPTFVASDEELSQLKEKLKKEVNGNLPERIVLINPNASDMLPLRKWETENFIELTRRLMAETEDVLFVLTGAPKEAPFLNEIVEQFQSPRVISMAGKTTLRELHCLYAVSDLLITNDSGPAHFASMTDINILVLFGPETPQLFGPIGQRVHIIWKALACSPCVNAINHRFSPCHNNQCMQQITVEEVATKAAEILKETSLALK